VIVGGEQECALAERLAQSLMMVVGSSRPFFFGMLGLVAQAGAAGCLPPATSSIKTTSTASGSSTSDSTAAGDTTHDDGSASGDTTTASSSGEELGALDARCETHADCASGKCFYIPLLGGLCSECLVDDDCEGGGCSLPVVLATPPIGARCTTGALGEGCMSDEICQEPFQCEQIIDVPTVIEASTCSECGSDADCGDELCSPRYHIREITGEWVCVPPGSVPNGEGCNLEGTGDLACASGFCAPASIMGLTQVGICGDCRTDEDCPEPQVCAPTGWMIGTWTVTPSACVEP